MKKKICMLSLAFCFALSSIFLVGCGRTSVYGKEFTYQGKINTSWSSLDSSYGKNIDDIIDGQIKAGNIDWTEVYLGVEKVDLTGEEFKNGKAVVEFLHKKYDEKVRDSVKDIVITFGTEEEKTFTASMGDLKLEYKMVVDESSEGENGHHFALLMVDGKVVEEGERISLYDTFSANMLILNGANFSMPIKIKVKEPIKDHSGDYVDFIEIDLAVAYSESK